MNTYQVNNLILAFFIKKNKLVFSGQEAKKILKTGVSVSFCCLTNGYETLMASRNH
jgi:hypothetical protein